MTGCLAEGAREVAHGKLALPRDLRQQDVALQIGQQSFLGSA
jgi:hypothetical protein